MTRDITLDIMKGIAILAVIAGHSLPLNSISRDIIYSFHMPLFFIVAGYLYKPSTQYRKKFKGDIKRLLIPYLTIAFGFTLYLLFKESDKLFALKYSATATIFGTACNHSSLLWATVPRIGAAWFLPALFWCRQTFNLLYTRTKKTYIIIAAVSCTAVLTDYYLINLPFAILPGLSAMMFYMIGHVTHMYKAERQKFLFLATLGFACWIYHLLYSHIEMSICSYGFYPIDIAGASFATAIIYYISRGLSKTKPGMILGRIGEISLYIYAFHVLEAEIKPYQYLGLDEVWYLEIPFRITLCVSIGYLYCWSKSRILSPIIR